MWPYVAAIIAIGISLALAIKPRKTPQQRPQGFQNVITAEEGAPIPVLFGTREFKSSNVVWYGDVKIESVKNK